MISLLVALSLAAPFPLPTIGEKPPAVVEGQKSFRLPIGFEKVKKFYTEQLGGKPEVKFSESGEPGKRVLTLTTKALSESWTKAIIRQGEVETVVEVTAVIRATDESISGNGKPLVEFIFGRSPEVQKALNSIDHAEQLRK